MDAGLCLFEKIGADYTVLTCTIIAYVALLSLNGCIGARTLSVTGVHIHFFWSVVWLPLLRDQLNARPLPPGWQDQQVLSL